MPRLCTLLQLELQKFPTSSHSSALDCGARTRHLQKTTLNRPSSRSKIQFVSVRKKFFSVSKVLFVVVLCPFLRGVGACEVLAMELKSRGLFVSRHISLDNVQIEQIGVTVSDAIGANHFEILYKRVSQIVSCATKKTLNIG